MRASSIRAFLAVASISAFASLGGCAADRPSRNGVFNENVYIRKDFLVRPAATGEGVKEDTGWMMKASILSTSTPNPLAPTVLWTGADNAGAYVRFAVTQSKLQMLNIREISDLKEIDDQGTRNAEVVDSWDAQSVDIKYRINLDGEKTNFLEENQELDWQKRQWVKVELNKNDFSDLSAFGPQTRYILERCVESGHVATTLVPDSVRIDEAHDYMEWKVQSTLPIKFDDEACVQSYGDDGLTFQKLGRQNVTAVIKYSMVRAKPAAEVTYKPLEVAEKDPILRKYGPIRMSTIARDHDTGLLTARELVMRYDPEKPIVYYFAKGYPQKYKHYFVGPNGIVKQTNEIFEKIGAKTRLVVKEYDQDLEPGEPPREYGDIRYSFVRWETDLDTGSPFIGVAQFIPDPRTGEVLSTSINLANFPLKEYVVQRIDAYLKTIGASLDINSKEPWGNPQEEYDERTPEGTVVKKLRHLPATCKDGDVAPMIPSTVIKTHNGRSSLFSKMQEYLGRPVSTFGNLNPHDFVPQQDADFYNAFYTLAPYYVFADPDTNQFVVPEGGQGVFGPAAQMKALEQEAEFHKVAASIDRGLTPYQDVTGTNGPRNAVDFLNKFRNLTLAHADYEYKQNFAHGTARTDKAGDMISFLQAMAKNARHCTAVDEAGNGRWETKEEWVENLIDTYHGLTVWHEFGHILGLEHNFMASVDRPNFPHYKDKTGRDHIGMFQSSVMEYNAAPDRAFWANETGGGGWGAYDRGALGWIYGNSTMTREEALKAKPKPADAHVGVSGQYAVDAPWRDIYGFTQDGKKEVQYLFCTHQHLKYTPLCRQHDFGTTPAEIIANDLDQYEWQYQWRNFRLYRKIWDNSQYASTPSKEVMEMRRFLSMWGFDWSASDLTDAFRRLGIEPPANAPVIANYYSQLVAKFNKDISEANQLTAAFHKAVIQQASGERPFRTIYDKYYGDVTQQGIILDKLFAMQGWVGMWPSQNYDPNQSGAYIASYTSLGDVSFRSVAEDTVTSMIGEQYYDSYPYFKPLAVMQFAQDTHSPNFAGRIEVRDWVGGRVFTRRQDMLDFFRQTAVEHHRFGCARMETCTYDPTIPRAVPGEEEHSDLYHEFIGPDGRRWAWVYLADRNSWVFADRDRNTATYKIVNDYNMHVIREEDDGASPGNAYSYQLPVKYFLDAYNYYN